MTYGVIVSLIDKEQKGWTRYRLVKAHNHIEAQELAQDLAEQILNNLDLKEIISIRVTNDPMELLDVAQKVKLEAVLIEIAPLVSIHTPILEIADFRRVYNADTHQSRVITAINDIYEIWGV